MATLNDLFCDSDFVTKPAVAGFCGVSEASARSYAAENDVPKAGVAFVWDREAVETYLDALDNDEEDEDEEESEDDEEEDDADDCDVEDEDEDDEDGDDEEDE
jgi:hypothetical protein